MNQSKCPRLVGSFKFQTEFSQMIPGKNTGFGCASEIKSPKIFNLFHCTPFPYLLSRGKKGVRS